MVEIAPRIFRSNVYCFIPYNGMELRRCLVLHNTLSNLWEVPFGPVRDIESVASAISRIVSENARLEYQHHKILDAETSTQNGKSHLDLVAQVVVSSLGLRSIGPRSLSEQYDAHQFIRLTQLNTANCAKASLATVRQYLNIFRR